MINNILIVFAKTKCCNQNLTVLRDTFLTSFCPTADIKVFKLLHLPQSNKQEINCT